jgi:hypothetical protein
MSLTKDITGMTQAVDRLTQEVTGKMGQIDNKVEQAKESFKQWQEEVEAADINGEASYRSVIDLTGLSTDYYYPVWWRFPDNNHCTGQMSISRHYSSDAGLDPFNNNKEPHVASLLLEMEGNASPWNGDANFLSVKRIHQRYRKTVRAIQFAMKSIARPVNGIKPLYGNYKDGQVVGSSVVSGCYLRGGLKYLVIKNFKDNLWYSRDNNEVSTGCAEQSTFEINWKVKAYHKDDEFLGEEYSNTTLAYAHDYDKRYTQKG